MTKLNDDSCGTTLPPSPLRPELAERLLSAMHAVSAEQGEEELERRLRRLRPAAINEERRAAWLVGMHAAKARRSYRGGWRSLHRWGAAAVLFMLCSGGGLIMMNGSASATVTSGLACRSVMETRAGDAVQWQEGQTALRSCEVLYEDSFVLDGDEDSTITVRVPVRTQVMIEEEVI